MPEPTTTTAATTTTTDPKLAATTTTAPDPKAAAATTTDPAATTTTAAPAAATTIADPAADPKAATAGAWPEDWRTRVAKGDDKRAKLFERYASPEAVADALVEAQNKIRSGALKASLPKDASEEQVAEWRKENGIPDKPEGYLEKLPDGIVLGEEDKAIAADFLASMHAENTPPAVAHAALKWYTGHAERQQQQRQEADASNWAETEESLRDEWGPEWRGNINAIKGLLGTLPGGEETAALILTARGADGVKLGGNAAVLRGLVQLAKQINPAATIAPGDPTTATKRIDDRLTEIRAMQRKDEQAYFANAAIQKEERELLAHKERLAGKSAA